MMRWLTTGLLRLLGGEPWTERRKAERRSEMDRRHRKGDGPDGGKHRQADRRREDRRGRGWLRFWNPP